MLIFRNINIKGCDNSTCFVFNENREKLYDNKL